MRRRIHMRRRIPLVHSHVVLVYALGQEPPHPLHVAHLFIYSFAHLLK
jgi:hypothetical protein